MATSDRPGVADFYEREVLPALDRAGSTRRSRSSAGAATRTAGSPPAPSTRAPRSAPAPDRVVCHGDAPRGFLIHGHGAVLWTTLPQRRPARPRPRLHQRRPHARRTRRRRRQRRSTAPPTAAERTRQPSRRRVRRRPPRARSATAARDGARLPRAARHPDRPHRRRRARRHADPRPAPPGAARRRLQRAARSTPPSLLADHRWPGRIVGAWRDEHQHVTHPLGPHHRPDDETRYLYLRGAHRSGELPYGLSDLLAAAHQRRLPRAPRSSKASSTSTCCAPTTSPTSPRSAARPPRTTLFERLGELGVERVVLALDNDAAGRTATSRAIDAAVRSARAPDLFVIDPDLLGAAKDPGELIRTAAPTPGTPATAAPVCAVTWRALELTGPLDGHDTELARRAGLAAPRSLARQPPAPPRRRAQAARSTSSPTRSATTATPSNAPSATSTCATADREHRHQRESVRAERGEHRAAAR